ncbi:MAG: DUF4856 domain-containing protein [Pseudomonadota bacterium]|nr:DUF4856 domain-containing protein [Pseudomonadota bacterium]
MKKTTLTFVSVCALFSAGLTHIGYSETFSEAFAKAKAAGLAEFSYNGNLYTTQTAEEAAKLTYGPFPITLKGYSGSKTNSVSYTGQIARHVLHDSLKKLAAKGSKDDMMSYYNGSDLNLAIVAPKSKDGFPVKQTTLNDISKGKNLSGKTYKGTMNAWPGQMTGKEALEFMINKAATVKGGVDTSTGYNYPQLISKFAMGAVFYNQAVDNYLDEKLSADNKPNSKPYKDGAYYTGKEHSWDEAFGYWGAAAHAMKLSPKENYEITKMKNLKAADANGDGVVDLKSEMQFAHAYYASSFDKGGKTNYLHTVTRAFIDGRQVITSANGNDLTDSQRDKLYELAETIGSNWEKVIAESVFKYAGSVYKDINKLKELLDSNSDTTEAFATYAKHWGELKGFSMALQAGKKNLGETAAYMNREIGFGPVLLNTSQVVGINSNGDYIKDESVSLDVYQMNMLKVQKLMIDKFKVEARSNDQTGKMAALADKLGDSDSAEND